MRIRKNAIRGSKSTVCWLAMNLRLILGVIIRQARVGYFFSIKGVREKAMICVKRVNFFGSHTDRRELLYPAVWKGFFEITIQVVLVRMVLGDRVVTGFQTREGWMMGFWALVLRFDGSNVILMMTIWGLLGCMGWGNGYSRGLLYPAVN